MAEHVGEERALRHANGFLEPEDEATLSRHLAACPACAAEVAWVGEFVAKLNAAMLLKPRYTNEELLDRVKAEYERREVEKAARRERARLRREARKK